METRSPVLSDLVHVETPENVRLAFRVAGPGARLGAYLMDLGIRIVALYGIITLLSILLFPFQATGLPTGAYFVAAFLLEWGYGSFFESSWNGQTPGKRAFRLRVIRTEGYAIGFYEAMLRNLLRAADFMPALYAAGFLTAASTRRMQRIGDLVAGTMVIRERRPELTRELAGLEDYEPFPMEEFRHRFRPSERTLEVIETLFLRRSGLASERVDEIASVLAEPLARRVEGFEERKLARAQPARFLFRVLRSCRLVPGDTSSPPDPAPAPAATASSRGPEVPAVP